MRNIAVILFVANRTACIGVFPFKMLGMYPIVGFWQPPSGMVEDALFGSEDGKAGLAPIFALLRFLLL